MATANPLEDQISCSICFEVYSDPQVLKECMHTFCHPCIQQLEMNGRVECPECRAVTLKMNVKRDFKIQSLIEAIKAQKEEVTSICYSDGCEMCQKPGRTVKYYCKNCQQFMCEECQTTHKGMKVCKMHTVKSIGQVFTESEMQIKTLIQNIEKDKKHMSMESQSIDKEVEKIRRIEARQIQDVEKYSEDIIKDVQENEKQLKKIIRDANANVIRRLQERKHLFSKGLDDIQAKIDFLEDLIKEQDLNALTESMENIKLNMKESVDQIKATLPSRDVSQSPVNVQKGADFDTKCCIQVTIDGSLYGSHEVKPVLQTLFSDLCNNQYVKSDEVDLGYYPYKLMEVNNEIWCGGESYINVYNQQSQKVNTITHHKLCCIFSICVTPSKELIVACGDNKNLHQLDIQGTYKARLAKGFFADVCYYEGELYALECYETKLLIFKKNNNKWQLTRSFKLTYIISSGDDKLCIHKTVLYISSWNSKCILLYNFQGQLLQQVEQGKSRLCVCDVSDSVGNILVADWTNHQIKLYDKQTGWRVVPVSGQIGKPRYALVDSVRNIWMVNQDDKLLKCVQQ